VLVGASLIRRAAAPATRGPTIMFDPNERHYSVSELATSWNISEDKVRELFLNEPGVLNLGRPAGRRKRVYRPIRIPESVAARVYARLTSGVSA